MFISVCLETEEYFDRCVLEKKQSVSDKLNGLHSLKMQDIYIFFYAQECWTFISLKNTKIKFKKDTHNPE